MIDTAKPTPGPYKLQISSTQPLALWSDDANGVILEAKWRHGFPPQRDLPCEEAIKNLSLAQKAFETYHETGLTPRQLLDQRDELQHQLDDIWLTVKHLKETIDYLEKRITTTFAKCGKVGG
jgi:hypothetical protein